MAVNLFDKYNIKPQQEALPEAQSPLEEQPQQQSLLDRLANDPATNLILGVGAGIQRPFYSAGNIINQAIGLPSISPPGPDEGSLSGMIGSAIGDIGGYMAGGAALKAGLKGMEALPAIGKAATYLSKSDALPNILRGGITGAGYGSLLSPDNRTLGGVVGGTLGVAGEAARPLGGVIKRARETGRLNKQAENLKEALLRNLSSGTHGQEDALTTNRQQFAEMLKQKYEDLHSISKEQYKNFFAKNNIGQENIFKKPEDIPEWVKSDKEPLSFEKAINKKNILSQQDRYYQRLSDQKRMGSNEYNEWQMVKRDLEPLKADINNFMSRHPGLAEEYSLLQKRYAATVVPFKQNRKIALIAGDIIEDPRGLATIFANPQHEEKAILDMIGDKGKDMVLYDVLGRVSPSETKESLHTTLRKLDEKGLLPVVSSGSKRIIKSFKDTMQELASTQAQSAKDVSKLKWGAGALGLPMGGYGAYELYKHLFGDKL